jgi:hypothetical protein
MLIWPLSDIRLIGSADRPKSSFIPSNITMPGRDRRSDGNSLPPASGAPSWSSRVEHAGWSFGFGTSRGLEVDVVDLERMSVASETPKLRTPVTALAHPGQCIATTATMTTMTSDDASIVPCAPAYC